MTISQETKVTILLAIAAVHALVLMGLSSRRRRSGHPALRFVLLGLSTVYFPLTSYVLSVLSTYISSSPDNEEINKADLLVAVVLTQFLMAKADMAALAVAAVASPVAGDDDINSLKIRPSMDSLVYSFWVTGLVIYSIISKAIEDAEIMAVLMSPLWLLGAGRMALRFASFQRATRSFALGRNVQLIDGYMVQLLEKEDEQQRQQLNDVPRLIVTGERNQDVEESPMGYRVKRSILEAVQDEGGRTRRLVTLDQVWSRPDLPHVPEDRTRFKDLCLSFALFKCLRRRFAGYRLAEAGSGWALRFVADGLLGQKEDHLRVFRVIGNELSFARDFYYQPLPVASLGTVSASLYFSLSFLILALLCILALLFIRASVSFIIFSGIIDEELFLGSIYTVLAMVNTCFEISEMVSSVRSNWTKMSIIGHYIRCQNSCARGIFSCLLRCKSPKLWSDKIGQTELFIIKKPAELFSWKQQPWAHPHKLFLRWRNRHKAVVKVPPEVKAAIFKSFRGRNGQLSPGAAAVRGWRDERPPTLLHDITWACLDSEFKTTTEVILVWHVASSLFEIRFPSPSPSRTSSSSSTPADNILVARTLSRYCMYLVAEAPDLLPDNSAWTKRRYEAVKKKADEVLSSKAVLSSMGDIEASSSTGNQHAAAPEAQALFGQLMCAFNSERSDEVLKKGAKLGKQLVEEAESLREGDGAAGAGEDAVWELLAEFWSQMVLYVAPSDNVKSHIEALQRGGELVTLLWALLLHAGITRRPDDRHFPVEEPES